MHVQALYRGCSVYLLLTDPCADEDCGLCGGAGPERSQALDVFLQQEEGEEDCANQRCHAYL